MGIGFDVFCVSMIIREEKRFIVCLGASSNSQTGCDWKGG